MQLGGSNIAQSFGSEDQTRLGAAHDHTLSSDPVRPAVPAPAVPSSSPARRLAPPAAWCSRALLGGRGGRGLGSLSRQQTHEQVAELCSGGKAPCCCVTSLPAAAPVRDERCRPGFSPELQNDLLKGGPLRWLLRPAAPQQRHVDVQPHQLSATWQALAQRHLQPAARQHRAHDLAARAGASRGVCSALTSRHC